MQFNFTEGDLIVPRNRQAQNLTSMRFINRERERDVLHLIYTFIAPKEARAEKGKYRSTVKDKTIGLLRDNYIDIHASTLSF